MRFEEPDFLIEISEKTASEAYNEAKNNRPFFIEILGFKYVAINVESNSVSYLYDNARYFLNLKRHS